MTLLLRVSSKSKNYQGLADEISAIEPPIWMALRAGYLRSRGREVQVIDLELMPLGIDGDTDRIEIFPIGNHPSAFIQSKEGVESLKNSLIVSGFKNILVWERIPDFGEETSPAWDLFPMEEYRAHNWHCWGGIKRTPYGVIATSLSCPYNCKFCCIKSFYEEYREIPIVKVMEEFDYFHKHCISNIKIIDELFFYKPKRVENICREIIKNDYKFNIWAYARVDTIKPKLLPIMKEAGFNWLGIGIESGNEKIRKQSFKGSLSNKKIKEVISEVKDNGIHIGGNFIFGFLEDNLSSMQETLDFAKDLNCEFTNFYTMMAYPGSQLYEEVKRRKWELPSTWSGYSQYSYDTCPMRTKFLNNEDVLSFRDKAFKEFYTSTRYLTMIESKFGLKTVDEIRQMTKIQLKRKLLGDVIENSRKPDRATYVCPKTENQAV